MANGKPGDHPITDILNHQREVFGPEADGLIRRLSLFLSRERLWELIDWLDPPSLPDLVERLREEVLRREADARSRGWEVDK